MGKEDLAHHETLDAHELLNMKTIGLLKSKMMQGVVFDEDLRALMKKNVEASVKDVKELKRLYPYTESQ
ncbi:spore coat protein [Alkalibacillus haloalkaliphilus]|uniref:Spore coat protein F-like protein YraG n=1 Tax=Alkalibacillus haloalkaliphilus TaxID=94136 RepID=A0A511W308_9BACI|nr:spore coat protein [Alkalibacillus haloalkaliphilus]GEN45465.1 spore coat protein F-like protein YraG [Alkalibacillus haloalkaliphilus]